MAIWASKLVIFRNDDLNSTFEIGKNSIKNIHINKENRIIEIEYKDNEGWEEQVIPFESLRWFNYTLERSEWSEINTWSNDVSKKHKLF